MAADRDRLPGHRRGGGRDGVHRFADRRVGRRRGDGGPAAPPGRSLERCLPVRAPPPAVGVLRRQLARPRHRLDRRGRPERRASTSGRPRRRSATTSTGCSTNICCRRARCASSACATTSATASNEHQFVSRLTGETTDRARAAQGRRRDVPRDADPVDAHAVVRRSIPDARFIPVNDLVALTEPGTRLHGHRRRQDGDGRVHLAARQRCGARRDPVDPAPRRLAPRPGVINSRSICLPMLIEGVSLDPRGRGATRRTSTISSGGSKRADSSCGSTRPSSPRCTAAPP